MEIKVFQPCACGWCCNTKTSSSLVLSHTCACAQMHSCVTDACLLSLSDRTVTVFAFPACARTLRLATDSHDHFMAQVRSKRATHFHLLSLSIQKKKESLQFLWVLVQCLLCSRHVRFTQKEQNNNHTHATVRFTKETFVTSGSRMKRLLTCAMSKWRKTL